MGYTTDFEGKVTIDPPLDPATADFLRKFNETRRMDRTKGPYYVDGTGLFGQGHDPDIRAYNSPPDGQPGLWCHWRPTDDGTAIEWDGGEKFYYAEQWMAYLIEHFLKPGCRHAPNVPGGYTLNGEIEAQGEEHDDRWTLVVTNNVVATRRQ